MLEPALERGQISLCESINLGVNPDSMFFILPSKLCPYSVGSTFKFYRDCDYFSLPPSLLTCPNPHPLT